MHDGVYIALYTVYTTDRPSRKWPEFGARAQQKMAAKAPDPGQDELEVSARQQHRELYERFCRQKFRDGGRGCSKTVSSRKREMIVGYLGKRLEKDVTPHFRFWVKSRGFQLVELGGEQVVCLPNKQWVETDSQSVQWKRVAAVEEFFDIISAHHMLKDGSHLGIKKTLYKIGERYDCVTRSAVEGYMEFCAGCRGRARRLRGAGSQLSASLTEEGAGLSFMSSTQVDLIDMNPHQDGQYQWLGHFTDHWSCFHILFPLTSVSADEVAQNLCRHVLSVFGAPQTLHCNLGRQFTSQVVQSLSRHWQGETETEVGKQRVHNPTLDQASSKLEELMAEYVAQKPAWTQWLPFLQYMLNTELTSKSVRQGHLKSPFNTVFSSVTSMKSEGEEEEVGDGGGSEDEEGEGGREDLQLEVISEAITHNGSPPLWEIKSSAMPPLISSTGANTSSEVAERDTERGATAVAGTVARGEDSRVQQLLLPSDAADFLSPFYESTQLTEGHTRKRKRKQTPVRVVQAATPPKTSPALS